MECLSPIYLKEQDAVVPCGKCANCRANLRQEWIVRLRAEQEACDFGLFITLTYDEQHVPCCYDVVDVDTGEIFRDSYSSRNLAPQGEKISSAVRSVSKRDCQLFLKRLRKALIPKGSKKQIRYFLVSEYGSHTKRPHYHGLFFFYGIERTRQLYDIIRKCWEFGEEVKFGEIEEGSIVYCTKYCLKRKQETPQGAFTPFTLMSRCPAIGSAVLPKYMSPTITNDSLSFVRLRGVTSRLPRYFRDKVKNSITSDELKEELQLQSEMARAKRQQEAQRIWFSRHSGATLDDYQEYLQQRARRMAQQTSDHCRPQNNF